MISWRLWLSDAGSTGAATTRSDLGSKEQLNLLDHLGGVVVGKRAAILEPPVLGGRRQAVIDALHELPLVVLREGQNLGQARRRAACRRALGSKGANTV